MGSTVSDPGFRTIVVEPNTNLLVQQLQLFELCDSET